MLTHVPPSGNNPVDLFGKEHQWVGKVRAGLSQPGLSLLFPFVRPPTGVHPAGPPIL